MDFKVPIFFDDRVFVYTRCTRIGNKSFDLKFIIARENISDNETEEIVLAEGKTVLVCYDYIKREATKIPEERKRIILEYEGEIIP